MEKLIIPQNCVIEGKLSSIANSGDICLENGMIPSTIQSSEGNIRLNHIAAASECETLMAPAGDIDLHGDSLKVTNLVSQSLTVQLTGFEAQTVQATQGQAYFSGDTIRMEQLLADSVEIEANSVHLARLRASGAVNIRAKHIHIEQLEGGQVTIAGNFQSNKVIARDGLLVNSGHVAIKNLQAPSFSSGEGVGGIVMVATCEQVATQGVRGFLRPSELGMFTNGSTTMDLSEILGLDSPKEPLNDMQNLTGSRTDQTNEVLSADPESWPENETAEGADNATPSEEFNVGTETNESESAEFVVGETAEKEASADQEQIINQTQEPEPDQTPQSEVSQETEIASENMNYPSLRTTLVVENNTDDDAEMKTIQLDPKELKQAIRTENLPFAKADDLLEPGDPEPVEDQEPEPEHNQVLNQQDDKEDSEDLPEIDQFEDYQTTGEVLSDSDMLDDPIIPENPLEGLAMPGEGENLWEDNPSDDISIEKLNDDIEVEELSEDDFYSVDDGDFEDPPVEEPQDQSETPNSENLLRQSLTDVLNQIRAFFPDENYPKFIYQIQNYVNEGRFNILAKPRNRDAVLASFEKLNHPEISQLTEQFYATLANFFLSRE